MPPKKTPVKKPNRVTPAPPNKNTGEEASLLAAQLDEDSWRSCVSLVVGKSPEDEELIQALASAVQQPQRKLFTLLTRSSIVTKISELGHPKGKKTDDVTVFNEVLQSARVWLDAGEDIPLDLMVKILKLQLLQVKSSDQQRREAEQIEAEKAKGNPPPDTTDKTRVSDKRGKTPSKPVTSAMEKKTKLLRRGEVEPPTYIDDEPDWGPQHYVLLVGFYQPLLIAALDGVGVHVPNVIKLCCDRTQIRRMEQEQQSCDDSEQHQTASAFSEAELAVHARKLDLFWSGLRAVLDSGPPHSRLHDVVPLSYTVQDFHSQDPKDGLELGSRIFEGVANLIYECLQWRREHQHYRDKLELLHVPNVSGSGHKPAEVAPTPPLQSPFSTKKAVCEESHKDQEVDMCYYNSLLDLIPPEACSVPLMLHCMLEQVVISTEPLAVSNHSEEPEADENMWLDTQLVRYILQSFLPQIPTEEEKRHLISDLLTAVQKDDDKKKLMEEFGEKEAQKKTEQPLVIKHLDERALRLRDISVEHGFNLAEVEASMTRLSPVLKRIQSVEKRRKGTRRWTSVRQQLQHFCSDETITWAEVERLFHLSVFEAMALTTVDERGVLRDAVRPEERLEATQQQSQTVIPWDDPEAFAKQQLPNLRSKDEMFPSEDLSNKEFFAKGSSQLDLNDMQRCRQRSLNDRHYTEHHSADVLRQVLLLASEEYCCLDAFRGTHNDALYIYCHNPMNPDRQCQEFWSVALHTDVKFRKYLEHVADTIADWTREEESKKEALVFRNNSLSKTPEEDRVDEFVTKEDTREPVIRKGSLKAWKAEQEQLQEEEMAKRLKTPKSKGKPHKEAQASAEKDKGLSGGKKSRPNTAGFQKEAPKEQTEEPSKSFQGYRMDGQLIHLSGHVQNLFPSDGGQITVENINFVEGSRLMKVAVKKDGHHFYTHINRVAVGPVKPPEWQRDETPTNLTETSKVFEVVERKIVKHGSFTAELDNKIHLSYSFYGPAGEDTGISPEEKGETPKSFTLEPSVPSSSTTCCSKGCEDRSDGPPPGLISGFNVSVPSGLLLQLQPEDTQGTSPCKNNILVRQSFPLHIRKGAQHLRDKSLSNELSRIITGQGDVVRFLKDGSTEVLFADGSVRVHHDVGTVLESDGEAQNSHPLVENPRKSEAASDKIEAPKRCWQTTTPTGSRTCSFGTTHVPTSPLLTHKATDPITNQVMLSREDLVVTVENPDGSRVVEHADGTRITSFVQNLKPLNGQKPEVIPLNWSCQRGSKYQKEAVPSRDGARNSSTDASSHNEQDIVTDNKGACEREEGGASNKEQVVMVEKEGHATVVMHPQRHTAQAFLADGTVVTGNNQGEYEVFPSSAGFLQIQRDGKCIYSSDHQASPNQKGFMLTNKAGTYTMSHADTVACNITDDDGNHFQVMEDGRISVLKLSSASSSREQFEEEEDGATSSFKHQCPRLFLLHADGSGTEFLSSHCVEKWLDKAYSDPTVALLKEPLPNTPDEFGITILKPSPQSVWSQWLLGKQVPDVTPPNLKNRSWHDFPGIEKRTPGPSFGTNIGVSLTLREKKAGPGALPMRSCPKVLEMRELHEHRPFTKTLRDAVDSRLKKYIESLMEGEQLSEERKVKDPRTEEEQERARDLHSLILCFPGEDDSGTPVDSSWSVGDMYRRGVGAPIGGVPEESEKKAGHSSESLTNDVDSKWAERLSKHRCELDEEKTYKEALRKKNIVPYFHPENFSLYQSLLQNQASGMGERSNNLPMNFKTKRDEAFMNDASQERTLRPLNPTPSQSESYAAETEFLPDSRPSNPTPHTAGEGSLRGSTRRCRSVQVDVTGKPRKTKVKLPNCIINSKARRVPNQNFLTVEEPVRRKCRTASLADPQAIIRGFQLLPWSVDFGVVQAGTLSTAAVLMKNVGVDTCRFHVKQPPPATGLRVLYNSGPVAAGLQTELKVQLFAMSSLQAETEPKKYISQDIIIHTETDIFYLPVTAIVVPEQLKDEENTGA